MARASTSEAHRRAVREYRLRHIAEGLCVRCSDRATDGRYCARHADQRRAQQRRRHKRRYEARLEAGICTLCGKRPPKETQNICEPCYQRRKPSSLASKRRMYARRRAAGLCPFCGTPAVRWGMCVEHLSYHQPRHVAIALRKSGPPRRPRPCPLCGLRGHMRRICALLTPETRAKSHALVLAAEAAR